MSGLPRFAFIVHALTPMQRQLMGLRTLQPAIVTGFADGTAFDRVAVLARLGIAGVVEGVIVGIPMDPEQLLGDQERAVRRMMRAVELVRPLDAVGLGSLCAVVAGRGEALQAEVSEPVTTGAAATAWAIWRNTMAVVEARGGAGPVAVVGSNGPVGRAVAALLADEGLAVRVDSRRGGRKLAVEVCDSAEEAVAGCGVIVGAGPTGASLDPAAVDPGAVIIDVALPDTLKGEAPAGVRVLAGEAVSLPPGWTTGAWGRIYQTFAGYGPTQVYACLMEPLVMAVEGRTTPYAQGRRLEPATVREFGEAAARLGFEPRLAEGFRGVAVGQLVVRSPSSRRWPRGRRLRAALSRGAASDTDRGHRES